MEAKKIIIGLGLLATAGVLMSAKKNPTVPEPVAEPTPAPKPSPIVLDKNKTLKKGVKGAEVRELQRLLGISADGDFGPATEAALLKAKGVTQITLNTFSSTKAPVNNIAPTPTVSTQVTPYKTGQRLMARISGAKLQEAVKKADNTYFPTNKIVKNVGFGQEVGTIVGIYKSSENNEYLYRVEFAKLLGASIFFARHSEVEPIK